MELRKEDFDVLIKAEEKKIKENITNIRLLLKDSFDDNELKIFVANSHANCVLHKHELIDPEGSSLRNIFEERVKLNTALLEKLEEAKTQLSRLVEETKLMKFYFKIVDNGVTTYHKSIKICNTCSKVEGYILDMFNKTSDRYEVPLESIELIDEETYLEEVEDEEDYNE